jgi:hypothetical protein
MKLRCEPGSAAELDQQMRAIIARMQAIDADLGTLLRRMADARLHRRLGFDDLGAYCRNVLGVCPRKAFALIALDRRRSCSRITSAYRSGVLSWHRCLTLLPVLTEQTAEQWIDRAQRVTARRLADEVLWSRMAYDAGLLPETLPPPLGAPLDCDAASLVQFRGTDDGAGHDEKPLGSVLLDVDIRFRAPITVACMLRSAIFARRKPHEPVWMGLLRLLEYVRAFWLSAPKHRDPIFARDGWRCAVPGCSSRRNLHDHHIEFRSRGGGNEQDNRITVCASHHLHGIHAGVVRASGEVSAGLEWLLGCRGMGPPLLCIRAPGELYAEARS